MNCSMIIFLKRCFNQHDYAQTAQTSEATVQTVKLGEASVTSHTHSLGCSVCPCFCSVLTKGSLNLFL